MGDTRWREGTSYFRGQCVFWFYARLFVATDSLCLETKKHFNHPTETVNMTIYTSRSVCLGIYVLRRLRNTRKWITRTIRLGMCLRDAAGVSIHRHFHPREILAPDSPPWRMLFLHSSSRASGRLHGSLQRSKLNSLATLKVTLPWMRLSPRTRDEISYNLSLSPLNVRVRDLIKTIRYRLRTLRWMKIHRQIRVSNLNIRNIRE